MSALLLLAGFFAGAIPFGVIIAKRRGVDIRKQGSGNIGATNVGRVLGIRDGLLVLLLDALKGGLVTLVAARFDGDPWVIVATGFAAILGHCFSPWLGGKGGKGVATALGVFVVLAPALVAVAVAMFAAVLAATRVPALGSLAAALTISVGLVAGRGGPYAALACATTALLVYTHRTNLAKLRARLRDRP